MMTATKELRQMLTDAGVKYFDVDEHTTYWDGILDGTKCGIWRAFEFDGLLHITFSDDGDFVTPQEAITFTVGQGTCKLERADWDDGMHWTWGCICTACNAHLEHETGIGYYNFCPVCGRRVIKDA